MHTITPEFQTSKPTKGKGGSKKGKVKTGHPGKKGFEQYDGKLVKKVTKGLYKAFPETE